MNKSLFKIVTCIAIAFTLSIATFFITPEANAATPKEFKIHCMSRVMYFGNLRRSEISENAANRACQNAETFAESNYISSCMTDLMYKSNSVVRRGMTALGLANICQKATTATLGQKINKCMRNTMYDSNGRLRLGMSASLAAKECSPV